MMQIGELNSNVAPKITENWFYNGHPKIEKLETWKILGEPMASR
jgi:hypothetical protein